MVHDIKQIVDIILNLITFLVHITIGGLFLYLGLIIKAFDDFGRETSFNPSIYLAFLIGITLCVLSITFIKKNSLNLYYAIIATTIISAILWIVLEGSVDVENVLYIYLVFFIPLSYFKYKLRKN